VLALALCLPLGLGLPLGLPCAWQHERGANTGGF